MGIEYFLSNDDDTGPTHGGWIQPGNPYSNVIPNPTGITNDYRRTPEITEQRPRQQLEIPLERPMPYWEKPDEPTKPRYGSGSVVDMDITDYGNLPTQTPGLWEEI